MVRISQFEGVRQSVSQVRQFWAAGWKGGEGGERWATSGMNGRVRGREGEGETDGEFPLAAAGKAMGGRINRRALGPKDPPCT